MYVVPHQHRIGLLVVGTLTALLLVLGVRSVAAEESASELQARIKQSQTQLQQIEAEIKKYEQQLTQVGAEKKTLQSAINELDLSRKKIQSEVRATEQKISSTDLEIEELLREIRVKELEIERDETAVAAALRTINKLESQSTLEVLLGYPSMTDMWRALEEHAAIRDSFRRDIQSLAALKRAYEQAKLRTEDKRDDLGELHTELTGQQSSLDKTRNQKDQLLTQTKNKESNYQQLLAEKRKAQAQFESDIAVLENQLRIILDPSAFPAKGTKVLAWPVYDPLITQGYGLTDFARTGAYGYENGQPKPHRAIDFRATIGTPILASLSGVVKGAVDMDATPGCRSYGQWILIEHPNGLSTLYTHLSSMLVKTGQSVTTGQIIGYSGNTGFSTAPHLHFGVFASQGVQVQKFSSSIGCKNALVPLAAPNAYLNPLDYL